MRKLPKIAREMAEMTQETAADMLHIDVRTLRGYEARGKASREMLEAMASLYDAPYLLADSPMRAAMLLVRATRQTIDLEDEVIDIAGDDEISPQEEARWLLVKKKAAILGAACIAIGNIA